MNVNHQKNKMLNQQIESLANMGSWEYFYSEQCFNWSDGLFDMLGYEPNEFEVTFEKFKELVHPDEQEKIDEFFKSGKKIKTKQTTVHLLTKSGKYLKVKAKANLLNLSNDSKEQLIGIFQDLSEQESTENDLKIFKERFELVNKASNNVIYDWDIVNDKIFWGEGLERAFGHKSNEGFKLNDWAKWIHPDDADEVLQSIDIFLSDQKQKRWSCEYRFEDYNEKYAYVKDVGYLVRDEKGKATRLIGIISEKTQVKLESIRQEIQEQLNRIFKKEDNLESSLRNSLKYLSEFSDYSAGEIWLTSEDDHHIRIMSHYARNKTAETYYEFCELQELKKGEGLAGNCWQKGEIMVWNNLDETDIYLQKKAIEKTHINHAVAYPLYSAQSIIGVVLFLHKSKIEDRSHTITNFKVLQNFLADEIIRKQQEEELNLFFESAPDILVIANTKGYFTKVNPAFCDLLGYTADELKSQPFKNFIHPDDLLSTTNEYDNIVKEGKFTDNFLNRYRTKSGEYKWISWKSSAGFGPDNLSFSYARDFTDIIKLQESIDNASKLAKVGGWEFNLVTQESYWSPITKEIHDVPPSFEPSIETGISFYHPDYRDLVTESVEKALKKGESYKFEAKIITAKGKEKWIRSIGNAELVGGECVRIYGSFQDISSEKAAKERLRKLSDNIPGVLFRFHLKTDGTQLVDYVSQGAKEIWGLTPQEAMNDISVLWKGVKLGGDFEAVIKEIQKSAQNLSRFNMRWRYVMPDGEIKFHDCFANPEKTTDGTIIWDAITIDATEFQYYETLADRTAKIARIGSWELKIKDEKPYGDVYWSSVTKEILEVEHDFKPTVESGFGFYIDKSRELIEHSIDQLIKKGDNFDLELLVETQKRNNIWIRIIGNAERIEGQTVKIYGSIQDINSKKTSEEKIKNSNERFEKAALATNDAIWDWNIKTNKTVRSGFGFEKQFGYKTYNADKDDQFWLKNIHPDDLERVQNSQSKAINNKKYNYWKDQYRFKTKSGEYAHVIDKGFIVRDESGEAIRMIGATTDITDRIKYEKSLIEVNEQLQKQTFELSKSNAELEQFAYVASHDLQEPLRMVSSFLTQLEKKYGDKLDEKGIQYINFAVDGAKRMRQIILDLLDYSRIGKHEEEKKEINLNEIIDEVCLLNRKKIDELDAKIYYKKLPSIINHNAPMIQLFQNLISNALKYIEEGVQPKIIIDASDKLEYWEFTVKDNGIGIDEKYFNKIFNIFQRLHNKHEYSGSGVGLAIVKKIIDHNNGKIWVDSEIGKGTTFHFTLPKV
ncbi:PAS domain-containing protein [Marivirga arenosa]|uniref:histidine kinase n=1 Tax=Marivirga arenosa TaxID=3059076 RepID=A0AA51ZW71_9BACT|nr:PAS domain-containing protein [Marivirga sp. BKB1-2]WNB17869.1 PAS domain-containing protein [Marivirga sp. BKB1-2]